MVYLCPRYIQQAEKSCISYYMILLICSNTNIHRVSLLALYSMFCEMKKLGPNPYIWNFLTCGA